ncbi:hypothetical protein C3B79_3122 [Aeromonas hydrophila]|nr:hypothetical protein C3B79_3122 [Aeromonas hydrophila]
MLVGFDIGLDELGSHQFDGMSQPSMPIKQGGILAKKRLFVNA